jgi:hypothetical protein
MAKEIIKVIKSWDDLELAINGRKVEAAPQVIKVGYNGKWYELDLCESNITDLETVLEPYRKYGRQVGGKKKPKAPPRAALPQAPAAPLALPAPLPVSQELAVPAAPQELVQRLWQGSPLSGPELDALEPPLRNAGKGQRSPERERYLTGMREYARVHKGTDLRGAGGYYNYPLTLRREFAAFVRSGQQHSDVA